MTRMCGPPDRAGRVCKLHTMRKVIRYCITLIALVYVSTESSGSRSCDARELATLRGHSPTLPTTRTSDRTCRVVTPTPGRRAHPCPSLVCHGVHMSPVCHGCPCPSSFGSPPPGQSRAGGLGHECLRARPAPSAGNQLAVRACLGPRCPRPHSPWRLPSPPAAKGRVRVPP